MLNRFATLAAVCMLVPTGAAPLALADPPPPAPVVPAADSAPPPPGGPNGPVPSGPPGVLRTPDGWTLNVTGLNESMEPVAPLTGFAASREYLVDGTFTGAITGGGSTKLTGGTLEAGYQIGCGILADDIESISSAGITPGFALPLPGVGAMTSPFPLTLAANLSGQQTNGFPAIRGRVFWREGLPLDAGALDTGALGPFAVRWSLDHGERDASEPGDATVCGAAADV